MLGIVEGEEMDAPAAVRGCSMEKEKIISTWFDMWLHQKMHNIEKLFSEDVTYIESWGPKYEGIAKMKVWFTDWNQRGRVTKWEIHQYFHQDNQTIVTWTFSCEMKNGSGEHFDGVSLIHWSSDQKIAFLQEFGCKADRYDPYQDGSIPAFRSDAIPWFSASTDKRRG